MSDGQINRLQVSGYKSIRHLDLQFTAMNVLIGPNGSGKSNFIGLFRFLKHLARQELQLYVKTHGQADKFLHFGRKKTKSISMHLDFSPNSYGFEIVPDESGGFVFKNEYWVFDAPAVGYQGGVKSGSLASPGASESGLPKPGTMRSPHHVARYIAAWTIHHFHDTSSSAAMKGAGKVSNFEKLAPDAANVAAFLYGLRDKPALERIEAAVRQVAPFFRSFVLRPEIEDPSLIRLRWSHLGDDAEFDASDLSDGTIRFVCLCALLLQPRPPLTILLDEPELGLHPHAIDVLVSLLRLASEKSQIIASTQSVTLANQLRPEEVLVVDRKGEATEIRRLGADELAAWKDEYALGEAWDRGLVGGTP
jgi:predicted ATPase